MWRSRTLFLTLAFLAATALPGADQKQAVKPATVETKKNADTQIFIKTVPEGAKVVVDGKDVEGDDQRQDVEQIHQIEAIGEVRQCSASCSERMGGLAGTSSSARAAVSAHSWIVSASTGSSWPRSKVNAPITRPPLATGTVQTDPDP